MTEAQQFFSTLSYSEIRRRQDLCQQQIIIAYERRLDEAMARLREMEEDLTQAMLVRLKA